jgi:outer membrane protein TolC
MRFSKSHVAHLAPTFALALSSILGLQSRAQAQEILTLQAPVDVSPRFNLEARLHEGERALAAHDVVRLAVEHSPRAEVTRISIRAAEAGVRRATAALVPRLDLSARYAHVDGFPDGRIGGSSNPEAIAQARALAGTVTDPAARTLFLASIASQEAQSQGVTIRIPRDQFAFVARLTIPLSDILFAVLPALHGAESRVRAEELRAQATQRDVELTALEAYYRYVEARSLHAVASAAHERSVERLAMITRMLEAGLLTPPDRIAVEAAVARAQEGVARAEGAVALARVALGLSIGDRERDRLAVDGALTSLGGPEGSIDALESRALDARPELLAMRESIHAQNDMQDATEASGYPHLGVYVGGDVSNPSPRIIPPRDEFIPVWEVGATLTWSPNDLATSMFAVEEMDAQIARTQSEILVIEDAVRLELRQAFEARASAHQALEAAETNLSAAEAAYDARSAQLRAGETVLDEVENADLRVTEAQLSVVRARLELVVAEARLRHAVGASIVD